MKKFINKVSGICKKAYNKFKEEFFIFEKEDAIMISMLLILCSIIMFGSLEVVHSIAEMINLKQGVTSAWK